MARDYLLWNPKKYGNVWMLRLQYRGEALRMTNGRKIIERSMGTADRALARIRSAPHIAEHRMILMFARAHEEGRITEVEQLAYEPGKTYRETGRTIMAARDRLIIMTDDGETHEEPNEVRSVNLVADRKEAPGEANAAMLAWGDAVEEARGIRRPKPGSDWIDTWVKTNGINKHLEADARRTWAAMQRLTENKPIRECTREDGKRLVEYLRGRDKGNSWSSVDKSIGLLRSACNVCDIEPNPFSRVMPKKKVGKEGDPNSARLPLSDADMAVLVPKIGELRDEDAFLFRLLGATGMRLDEAFQIKSEEVEDGVRYAWVGTKTTSSWRRVPFPSALLPLFPSKVTGPLFTEKSETIGKRLRYWMKANGVGWHERHKTGDKRKVVHSLRHRAKDLMRRHSVPNDMQLWLLGHERDTSDGYGSGYPMTTMLEVVDRIEAANRL